MRSFYKCAERNAISSGLSEERRSLGHIMSMQPDNGLIVRQTMWVSDDNIRIDLLGCMGVEWGDSCPIHMQEDKQ